VTPFWLSWYAHPDDGPFELHSPWWVSGFTMEEVERSTIVAAVRAVDEEDAWEIVRASYDTPPTRLEVRFCEVLRKTPFGSRFPRADWMVWAD
jgi:hypothetical protein